MQYLIPFLSPWVVAPAALLIWWWQTVFKRRMEVAERALLAFDRAEEGLSIIRSPASTEAEEAEVTVPAGLFPEEEARHRRYGIYFRRLSKQADKFEDIAVCQTLCRVHINQGAVEALEELLQVRHAVWVAAHMLSIREPGGDLSTRELYNRLQYDLWRSQSDPNRPNEYDRLTPRLYAAKAKLQAACDPYFHYPFVRFYKNWKTRRDAAVAKAVASQTAPR